MSFNRLEYYCISFYQVPFFCVPYFGCCNLGAGVGPPPPQVCFLIQQNGDFILQQNGDKIIVPCLSDEVCFLIQQNGDFILQQNGDKIIVPCLPVLLKQPGDGKIVQQDFFDIVLAGTF